jgi:hypothetical protein
VSYDLGSEPSNNSFSARNTAAEVDSDIPMFGTCVSGCQLVPLKETFSYVLIVCLLAYKRNCLSTCHLSMQ